MFTNLIATPQIITGRGLSIVGTGLIYAGQVIAGTGDKLAANGWMRRLTAANVAVKVVKLDGSVFVDGNGDKIKGAAALQAHFCNASYRLQFTANDQSDSMAVQAAKTWQEQFDQRTKSALQIEMFPAQQPQPQPQQQQPVNQPQPQPQPAQKTETVTISQGLQQCDIDDCECC